MNTQIIPKKIQSFIESIPENGAVTVSKNSWEGPKLKAIGKINGRLEFFEYEWDTVAVEEGEPSFSTRWIWHFEAEPEQWKEHFDVDCMPRKTGRIFEEVFI
jgi:hypothetical protein